VRKSRFGNVSRRRNPPTALGRKSRQFDLE
jgi:hypothetical protein